MQKEEIRRLPNELKKWGLLGAFGIKDWLKPIDEACRSPFLPYGFSGLMAGAALVFFAYIGFDSISTHSEEAISPKRDVPIGILASLALCTVLYILMAGVITGMEPYPRSTRGPPSPPRSANGRKSTRSPLLAGVGVDHLGRGAGRNDERAAGDLSQPGAHLSGDGPRRIVAAQHFRRRPRAVPHAAPLDDGDGRC